MVGRNFGVVVRWGFTVYIYILQISKPEARSFEVQNLKPYTYYKLRIIAENVKGRSNASEPTRQFQTLQAAPDAAPGNLTVRALNATALRVSWTVSISFNFRIPSKQL